MFRYLRVTLLERRMRLTRSTKLVTWGAVKRALLKPSMFHRLRISSSSGLGGWSPPPVPPPPQFWVCRFRLTFPAWIKTRTQGNSPMRSLASTACLIHGASASRSSRSLPPISTVLIAAFQRSSIRAPPPLSLQITHPGSRILEFAALAVAIHQEHGHSALAGPGERHRE